MIRRFGINKSTYIEEFKILKISKNGIFTTVTIPMYEAAYEEDGWVMAMVADGYTIKEITAPK